MRISDWSSDVCSSDLRRYTKELERLLTVLERRLAKSAYVAGHAYTPADMAIWPGRASAFVMGMGLAEWPAPPDWFDRLHRQPAVPRVLLRADTMPPATSTGSNHPWTDTETSQM